jgi:predicted nuclease with TOPRIM domain|tara:strand:+ start:155 stop:382 length:228 start_codon:yes stop_codon:yes gene_type:complete
VVKVKNLKEKQSMEKKPSKGPLSKYKYETELVYEKKKAGVEEMKKDMLKMMDKIDRLEDAYKFLKQRVNRLDGMR